MKPARLSGLGLLALCLCGEPVFAGPRLVRLVPSGGQRGTTVEVELTGRDLEKPREVLFYEPGIAVESITPETDAKVRVRLRVAADCPLGPVGLRLRTDAGLSEYQRFFVGPFPVVEEGETPLKRNDKPEAAVDVPANTTVFGRMNDAADIDLYRMAVKKGQRVSAEIESARIGVDRGIPDLHLTILSPDGKPVAAADDSALFVQDPVLSVVADRDGAYLVQVRHSTYNGTEAYRLHVGTFARPTGLYPAGGPVGTDLKVRVLGDPKGAWEQSVHLPASESDVRFVAESDGGPAPSPNKLRASPFPNVLESEPNDTPEAVQAVAVDLPVAFNGIVERPGDVDCFRFRARKGESFRFHALSAAIGSPLDATIWVRPLTGKASSVQRSSDSRANQLGLAPSEGLNRLTHDPVLDFTAPADGEYVLGVEDERGEGGADYVYRVEARPAVNAVHAYIAPEPENRNTPQYRQAMSVAAGNRLTAQVAVFATAKPFDGELELVPVNLPKGVTFSAPTLTPGRTKVPVVFEAALDAKPAAALVDLLVRPVGKTDPLPGGFRQTVLFNQYGNGDYYLHAPVERLAVAVTEAAPFRVEVDAPKTALVQNGETVVRFRVHRADGFDGPVTVQMEWKPTGIITATPVTVPAGKTDGEYTLGAARNAGAGTYSVVLTAMSGSGGRRSRESIDATVVSSAAFPLTVAEPHVEAKIGRASVERNKTATVTCKLTHLQAFEGKASATLARLPRGVELVDGPKEITAADKEVAFTIRATPDALVGNYQGVTLDLTVQDKGQAVRQLTGYGVLRIDAERGTPGKK